MSDTATRLQAGVMRGNGRRFYSHKIESLGLLKCPYDHKLTNKAYLSAVTVTSIFQSFTYKMGAKTSWHIDRLYTEQNYVIVTLCTPYDAVDCFKISECRPKRRSTSPVS